MMVTPTADFLPAVSPGFHGLVRVLLRLCVADPGFRNLDDRGPLVRVEGGHPRPEVPHCGIRREAQQVSEVRPYLGLAGLVRVLLADEPESLRHGHSFDALVVRLLCHVYFPAL